jgi:Ca-activated chloride channel family protein
VSPGPALDVGVLGYAARLAEPRALWLLGIVAALAAVAAAGLARRRSELRRAVGELAPRVATAAGTARPAARQALGLAGLALLALSLARPQCGTRTEVTSRAGVDLVIALDASRSMRARDVPPDRIERARLEVGELLGGLAGDRVAIVSFAADPFVQCPLTTDYAAARLFLRAVAPEAMPAQGTDVGAALRAARDVLAGAEGEDRTRVVLLVSDGEDHEGEGPRAAAALADEGIRVHVLAVGGTSGAPVPRPAPGGGVAGSLRDRGGRAVVTRRDQAALWAVAGSGGGEVFEIGSPDRGLAAFQEALARMERSELEGRTAVSYEDRYALAALPAFVLLLAGILLPEGRRPRREAAP